jgi:AmiR/NasT family two-component response regulator
MKSVFDLNLCLILEPSEGRDELVRELQRLRSTVTVIWPMPGQLPIGYQLILTCMCVDLADRIPWLPGQPACPLILISSDTDNLSDKFIRNCTPHSILHLPATPVAVLGALSLSTRQYAYEKRLRERIDKLDENLQSVRQIERAKAILVGRNSCSETEAYIELRSLAMEKRMTVASVANALISAESILG